MVLLGGEPGSGKSRLVREFAAEAAEAGALVLYGACDAVVHTPYGPFSQALERLAAMPTPTSCERRSAHRRGELTRLLPSLAERLGELPPPTRADPDTERHRLHTLVTDLLERVSRRRPVVLVIEDGHWADAPTLLLLRHLAQAPWTGRVLLFATFRDTEADVPEGSGADAGRPAARRRRRAAPTGRPLRRGGRRVRRSASPTVASARDCPRSPARSSTSRAATRSWCASCGGRSSRRRDRGRSMVSCG